MGSNLFSESQKGRVYREELHLEADITVIICPLFTPMGTRRIP